MEGLKKLKESVAPHLSTILTAITVLGATVGVYSTLYADVQKNKVEIENLKQAQIKSEDADKTSRKEAREDLKDVKEDVREIRQNMQKVLEELYKLPKTMPVGKSN